MTASAQSFAARLEQLKTDHAVYEAAQLGDIMWMETSLAEVRVVDPDLRARWTQRIDRLREKIEMRLGEFGEACGAAAASLSEATLAAADRALEEVGALWEAIEETETILAQDVPAILDSGWRPFPPHLEAARAARRGATEG